MKLYLIQNYDYEENGSYITITDTKEKALKIANDYIDKRLEDESNIPSEELTEDTTQENYINRKKGILCLDSICAVEIYETETDKELSTWLGWEVL